MVLVTVTLGAVFLVGMRMKSPPVINAVRRFNKAVLNPRQMESAGTPGAYASVVQHIGRTTGRSYGTPVGAVMTEAGFVIGLPYGTRPDWVKNVLAGGPTTIVHEGAAYQVDQPEVVPMTQASHHFPVSDHRAFRLFNVTQCLQVQRPT